jgi:uncharacterized membrane protein YccC
MMSLIKEIKNSIIEVWINIFWKSPNHLWALKVSISIAALLVPSILIFQDSFIATTLALGVVAMALGETDVHPRGRLKSASISLILFFITSSFVELFFETPVYFSLIILCSAFSLTIAGGLNSRMQGVTFGTLLIFVYTMLGADTTEIWIYQPILYTIGAFHFLYQDRIQHTLQLRYPPHPFYIQYTLLYMHFLVLLRYLELV